MGVEILDHGTRVLTAPGATFGTDALLLGRFALPRRGERALDMCSGCGIISLLWHDAGHRGPCTALELDAAASALCAQAAADKASQDADAAQSAYDAAVKAAADAKKAADEAVKKEAQGAAGWFQTDDAEQAYKYLTDSSVSKYLEYTHIGAKDDATSLDNLLKALDMIDECNRLREENGLEPLKVSETALAMAMVQANYAANGHYGHNYQYENTGENLAWGTSDWDPYEGWYTAEKANYDAAVKSGDYPDLAGLSAYDISLKYPDLYQKIGHYLNIISPDYTATGMAYSGYGANKYSHGFSQEFFNEWNSYNKNDTVYDAAVYRTMVENYVNGVRNAQSTYDAALKKVDEAKAALDKANQTKASTADAKTAAEQAQQAAKAEAAETAKILTDATAKSQRAQTAYDQAKTANDQAQADYSTADTARQAAQTVYDEAKTANDQAQTNLKNAQAKLEQAQQALDKAQADKTTADERVNILTDAENALATAKTNYEQAKSEAEQAKQASESAKADLKAKQDAYTQAKAKSDEAERQVKDLEAALADLRAKTDALTAAQSDLDTKIQAYQQAATARDEATKQVEQAKTDVKNAEQALTDAKAKLEQARKDAKDTDAVKAAQSAVDKAQSDLDAAKQALDAAQAKLADAKTTQAKAKSDYDKAQAALAAAIKNAADRNGSKTDGASGPQIEQAGLKASEKATSNAAAKADQVMASTGANTNGMLLAAVALTGIGWTMLDMKRRRMDVTARHGMR